MKTYPTLRLIVSALFWGLLSTSAWSQTAPRQDEILLENGTIVRGQLLPRGPGQVIRMVVGADTLSYSMAKVAWVNEARQGKFFAEENLRLHGQFDVQANVYMRDASSNYYISEYVSHTFGVTAGIRLSVADRLSLGLALSADWAGRRYFFPLILETRFYLSRGPVMPYLSLAGGYAFGNAYDGETYGLYTEHYQTRGGFYGRGGMGCRFRIRGNVALNTGFGPRVQVVNTLYSYGRRPDRWIWERFWHFSCRLGVEF
jgi:hypothetical protein